MIAASGRAREAARIRRANRACAAGRLLLGEVRSWSEFLEPDTVDLEALPRRQLKSGSADITARLSGEINRFCRQNFEGMSEERLAELYEAVKAARGLELPLSEFERRFGPLSEGRARGVPRHATVCISLWGLQFKSPEDFLSKDVAEALRSARNADRDLAKFLGLGQAALGRQRDEIRSLTSRREFCARSCILAAFNLLEAFLNGLAWEFANDPARMQPLSKRQQDLLTDSYGATLRDKILKYPAILTGQTLWAEDDPIVRGFLDDLKPLRDSLVHPSPFSSPARFGGRDKLRAFYLADARSAEIIAAAVIEIMTKVWKHMSTAGEELPGWLAELRGLIAERVGDPSVEWDLFVFPG